MNLSFTNNLWHHFISLIVIYLRFFVYNEKSFSLDEKLSMYLIHNFFSGVYLVT